VVRPLAPPNSPVPVSSSAFNDCMSACGILPNGHQPAVEKTLAIR
jgi:hypothetical protein